MQMRLLVASERATNRSGQRVDYACEWVFVLSLSSRGVGDILRFEALEHLTQNFIKEVGTVLKYGQVLRFRCRE